MLTYQYRCEQNGETVEVRHRMTEKLTTWGDVCARLERDPGATPAETPVERLISGGLLGTVNGSSTRSVELPTLPVGCCGRPATCRHHG